MKYFKTQFKQKFPEFQIFYRIYDEPGVKYQKGQIQKIKKLKFEPNQLIESKDHRHRSSIRAVMVEYFSTVKIIDWLIKHDRSSFSVPICYIL